MIARIRSLRRYLNCKQYYKILFKNTGTASRHANVQRSCRNADVPIWRLNREKKDDKREIHLY